MQIAGQKDGLESNAPAQRVEPRYRSHPSGPYPVFVFFILLFFLLTSEASYASEARPLITYSHTAYSQRGLRYRRTEATSAADDKARRWLLERSFFPSRFDKQIFFFVVVVEVHFFFSYCTVGKGRFYTFRENRKGHTEGTENTNRLESQENTKRPLGKYKQHQLSRILRAERGARSRTSRVTCLGSLSSSCRRSCVWVFYRRAKRRQAPW